MSVIAIKQSSSQLLAPSRLLRRCELLRRSMFYITSCDSVTSVTILATRNDNDNSHRPRHWAPAVHLAVPKEIFGKM